MRRCAPRATMDAWVIDGSTPHDGCTHWHAQDSISAPVSTTASATSRSSGSRPSCSPTVSRLLARGCSSSGHARRDTSRPRSTCAAQFRGGGAPGPRALRRSLDASRRLGRRGRDALAGRDARDRAGIGHPEPGDLARGAPRPASARALAGLFHSWKAFFLCEMLGGEPRGRDRWRSSSTSIVFHRCRSGAAPRAGRPAAEHWRKQPLPADFD